VSFLLPKIILRGENVEPINIAKKIYEATERLNALEKHIAVYSANRATEEGKYDIALAREIARLLDSGKPATVADKLAKGNISEIKQAHDNAEYLFEGIKLKARAIENQISGLQSILKHQAEI
jgi:hypothetical protein